MAITRTPLIDDDGSGTTGTILNNAWQNNLYNQIDAADGTWQAVPFNAAYFRTPTAGATWVVTSAHYNSVVTGKKVFLGLVMLGTGTITGAPVRLFVTVPPGLVPSGSFGVPYAYYVSGQSGTGIANVQAGSAEIDLLRDVAGTTFPAGDTFIYLQLTYSIA
jgi:hypothetical protein